MNNIELWLYTEGLCSKSYCYSFSVFRKSSLNPDSIRKVDYRMFVISGPKSSAPMHTESKRR